MHDDDNDDDDADDFCMRPWDIVRTCHWWKESRQQFEVPPLPQSIFFVLRSSYFFSFEDNLSVFSVSQSMFCLSIYVCVPTWDTRTEAMWSSWNHDTSVMPWHKSDVNQQKWFWRIWSAWTRTCVSVCANLCLTESAICMCTCAIVVGEWGGFFYKFPTDRNINRRWKPLFWVFNILHAAYTDNMKWKWHFLGFGIKEINNNDNNNTRVCACKFILICECESSKLRAQKKPKKIYLFNCITYHTVLYTTRGMNFEFSRPNRFDTRLWFCILYTYSVQVEQCVWLGWKRCIPQINVPHFIHIHFIISVSVCVCVALHLLVFYFT